MENTKIVKKGNRVGLLDELRGLAILCMVVYHTMFLLGMFGVNIPLMSSTAMNITRDLFAGMFIFISGCMCRFSHNNLKRGVICFFCGMIITFVVPFFADVTITFGILHFLGISMLIYGLFGEVFEKLPPWVGIIICVLMAVCTWNIDMGFFGIPGVLQIGIPNAAYNVGVLFPLGIYNSSFQSWDYFPLLPWFFVFIGGSYFGEWAKNGSLPRFFYPIHIKWLAAVGRHTIWIYLLHIPIIFLILNIIF